MTDPLNEAAPADAAEESTAPDAAPARSDAPPNGRDVRPGEPEEHPEQPGAEPGDAHAETDGDADMPAAAGTPQVRTGAYHLPDAGAVRLVRLHRYRNGMFEVYEFRDEQLPRELQETVIRQGGWRDTERQWYDLVEAAHAVRYEIPRRGAAKCADCAWEGWMRLGSRYMPPRPCGTCGSPFRDASEHRTLCEHCAEEDWKRLDGRIEALRTAIENAARVPKGSWTQVQELRALLDTAEKQRGFSRARISRLRQKLHPVYRVLIERRRLEQEKYRGLVAELGAAVKDAAARATASPEHDRGVAGEIKRLRARIRLLADQRSLGVREYHRLSEELKKAAEHEEQKLAAHRKALEEMHARWEASEKAFAGRLNVIEVGTEHSAANWEALQTLRDEITGGSRSGDLGSQGEKRLLDLLGRLKDQEGNLREMARQDTQVKRHVKKHTSRTHASTMKKTIHHTTIGLGFSQETWDTLVGLQRDTIRMKNEGLLSDADYKAVLSQINDKLDTLRKLKGWSS